MHLRIAPNTMGMEYYARAFSALLRIERANVRDLCKLTELDSQSVSHVLKNLEKAQIVRSLKGLPGEFAINIETEKLLELIEKTQKKEFVWAICRNKKEETRKNCRLLACTSAARY